MAVLLLISAACGRVPEIEAISQPRLTDEQFIMADGVVLPMRQWLPAERPHAIILALHGFNDYSKAFVEPGKYWSTRGIATIAYDQRGFGAAPRRGYWAGHGVMAGDVSEAARLLRERYPGTPLFVLGNSMGAAIAMIAASSGNLKCDGLILVAPALRSWRHLGFWDRLGLWVLAHVAPRYSPATRNLKFRASDNDAMLRALSRDSLVIRQSRMDTLKGLVDAMSTALDAAPRIHTPTLVLYGKNDELIPRASVAEAVTSLPAASRSAEYRQGWHMLLRDLNAAVVLEDVVAWIIDGKAPLPSGAEISPDRWVENRLDSSRHR